MIFGISDVGLGRPRRAPCRAEPLAVSLRVTRAPTPLPQHTIDRLTGIYKILSTMINTEMANRGSKNVDVQKAKIVRGLIDPILH